MDYVHLPTSHASFRLNTAPSSEATDAAARLKPPQELPMASSVKLKSCISANVAGFWQDVSHSAVTPPPLCTWCTVLFHSASHCPVFLHSLQSSTAVPRQVRNADIPTARLMSDLQRQPFTTRRLLKPFSVFPAAFSHTATLSASLWQPKNSLRTETGKRALYLLQAIWKCCSTNAFSRLCAQTKLTNKPHDSTGVWMNRNEKLFWFCSSSNKLVKNIEKT